MAYQIFHTNGTNYASIGDGVLDTSLGISLIGQNFHNYGQLIANNFLQMLEHQANNVPPPKPIEGQIWWDSANKQLKVYDGTQFNVTASGVSSSIAPTLPKVGDQWWDDVNYQLNVFNSSGTWTVIGPQYTKSQAYTGFLPTTIKDINNIDHIVSTLVVTGVTVAVLSKDATFSPLIPFSGITQINEGINFVTSAKVTGTATNAERLGGYDASTYINRLEPSIQLIGSLSAASLSVGSTNPLVTTSTGSTNVLNANYGNISLRTNSSDLTLQSNGEVTINNGSPTSDLSLTPKVYVDTTISNAVIDTSVVFNDRVNQLVNGAYLDTLGKLSTAINNDASYYTTVSSALNLKANIANPIFTGNPSAPTQTVTDVSNRLATTAFVYNALSSSGQIFSTANTTFIPPLQAGQSLVYSGTAWTNQDITQTVIDSIPQISGVAGQVTVNTNTVIDSHSTITKSIGLANNGVAAGNYSNVQSLTIDSTGRVSNITATITDSSNPTQQAKVFDSVSKVGWWFAAGTVSSGATHWNNINPNYANAFVDIHLSTYRNHPMYNIAGYYSSYFYASTICAQAVYEFKCPQKSRILMYFDGTVTVSSSNLYPAAAIYVRIDKYDEVSGTWSPVDNIADGYWSKVTASDGSPNGYISVPADTSTTKTMNNKFVTVFPPQDAVVAYNQDNTIYTSIASSVQDALPANVKHRIITQLYCLSTTPAASLSDLMNRSWFTLKGE